MAELLVSTKIEAAKEIRRIFKLVAELLVSTKIEAAKEIRRIFKLMAELLYSQIYRIKSL